MLFKSIRTSFTVLIGIETRSALSSDTAPVSDLDMFLRGFLRVQRSLPPRVLHSKDNWWDPIR